jgi:hypothetical protein
VDQAAIEYLQELTEVCSGYVAVCGGIEAWEDVEVCGGCGCGGGVGDEESVRGGGRRGEERRQPKDQAPGSNCDWVATRFGSAMVFNAINAV